MIFTDLRVAYRILVSRVFQQTKTMVRWGEFLKLSPETLVVDAKMKELIDHIENSELCKRYLYDEDEILKLQDLVREIHAQVKQLMMEWSPGSKEGRVYYRRLDDYEDFMRKHRHHIYQIASPANIHTLEWREKAGAKVCEYNEGDFPLTIHPWDYRD